MTSSSILVSFIVATKNSSSRIHGLFNSFNDHCPKDSFEVLISDSQSCDMTLDIVRYYSNFFPIQIVSRIDSGIYNAWNNAIPYAVGDWLVFLGDDDEIYNTNEAHSSFEFLRSVDSSLTPFVIFDAFLGSPFSKRAKPLYNRQKLWQGIKFFHPSSALSRHSFIRLNFDESLRIISDYKFFASHKLYSSYSPTILTTIGQNGLSKRSLTRILLETIVVNCQIFLISTTYYICL